MRKTLLLLAAVMISTAAAFAQEEKWWGYTPVDAQTSTLGTRTAETYHCAIYVPEGHGVASGKTIKAIRFSLKSANVTNIKAWIATKLPNIPAAANTVALVNLTTADIQNGIAEAELPEPIEAPEGGFYVGYSFKVSKVSVSADGYPIVYVPGDEAPNTMLIRTSQSMTSWSDMNGQGFGRLYLHLLLEGEFAAYSATPKDLGSFTMLAGQSTTGTVSFENSGSEPVTSLDYVISSAEDEGEEVHVDLSSAIAFGGSGSFQIPVQAKQTQDKTVYDVRITKVNGEDNDNADAAAHFTVYTLTEQLKKAVAVEEYTGTGCGWCPRGMIGMEKLRETFGDKFVGIAIHQYNSGDPMFLTPSGYAPLSFSGAPSCRINRGDEVDPYYGTSDDIRDDVQNELNAWAMASIEAKGQWNSDATAVEASATVTPLFDGSGLSVEFVLVADDLYGTTAAWNQSNYYYQYGASQLPADLAIFGSGGKQGTSTVSGWHFNDVAIKSSYESNVNKATPLGTLQANEKGVSTYTLGLPAATTALGEAIQKDKVYLAALLINEDGRIENAVKVAIDDYQETDGISTLSNGNSQQAVARYSLEGHRLSAPQRGLNIVRMDDGSVRKVIVK